MSSIVVRTHGHPAASNPHTPGCKCDPSSPPGHLRRRPLAHPRAPFVEDLASMAGSAPLVLAASQSLGPQSPAEEAPPVSADTSAGHTEGVPRRRRRCMLGTLAACGQKGPGLRSAQVWASHCRLSWARWSKLHRALGLVTRGQLHREHDPEANGPRSPGYPRCASGWAAANLPGTPRTSSATSTVRPMGDTSSARSPREHRKIRPGIASGTQSLV